MAELLAKIQGLSKQDKIALMQAILELIKDDENDTAALERAQLIYAQGLAANPDTKWLEEEDFWSAIHKKTGFKKKAG